ncbi:MAG: hypothetical protein AAFN77_24210 [Planctomycetota bacterium]
MWNLSPKAEEDVKRLYALLRRPSLFFGSRNIGKSIERLAARNEPAAISAVASGLFSNSMRVHKAASLGIKRLLALVPSMELVHLNKRLTGHYQGYISEAWQNLKPKYVSSFLAKSSDIHLGCLLSLHNNGYIRQAATQFLAKVRTGEELRFILIRQNDWVEPISSEAQLLVRSKLSSEYLSHFVAETDLLFHLLRCKRRDLSKTVSKYVDLLIEPAHNSQMHQAIDSSSKIAGRSLVKYLLQRDGDHLPDAVRFGIDSSDEVIRVRSLKRADDCLMPDECNNIANKLMSDRFPHVRHEAYELKARLSPKSIDVWQRCLLDKSRALRGSAMFYLGKLNCDVAAIYRKKLAASPNSLAALSGLVASGDESDLKIFSDYSRSLFSSRRAEAVRGIGRVGDDADILELQQFLLDESSRVVRAAHQQLQPIANSLDSDHLFALIEDCKTLPGKDAILRLLMEKGRWSSLSYLIRGSANSDQSLSSRAKALLDYTISRNRVFTQPSPKQREQIQLALDESQLSIDLAFFRSVGSYLSSFGFTLPN